MSAARRKSVLPPAHVGTPLEEAGGSKAEISIILGRLKPNYQELNLSVRFQLYSSALLVPFNLSSMGWMVLYGCRAPEQTASLLTSCLLEPQH